MKNKTRNATILGIAAGLALIGITRAVIRKYRRQSSEDEGFTGAPPNRIFSAYRGKFKPHRRRAADTKMH